MPFPTQREVEIPLLQVLVDLGGAARPQDIYGRVAAHFPQLTAEEQEQRLPNYPSTRKWTNLVQWVRQTLVEAGEIDRSERGIWRITDAGLGRLRQIETGERTSSKFAPPAQPLSLRDLMNANAGEVKARLLNELTNLTARTFEHFCRQFLAHLGYRNVEVTRRSQDGGIDGHGDFRQGAISIRSAFQAKKWTETVVGRPEIDKFRGAIQGEFDHGVFLTTSRFSRDAKAASYKKGAISILLLDGTSIADLLFERGLGVRASPLYVYDVDEEFFDIDED